MSRRLPNMSANREMTGVARAPARSVIVMIHDAWTGPTS